MDKKEWGALILVLIILAVILLINMLEQGTLTACTLEARICPDGTAVGRTGPNCEFAPCPDPFTICMEQGNPIMESYPRRCQFPDGTTVTEVLS